MKQWVTRQDGVESIKLEETKTPTEAELKDGEILVKIGHVSLNYRDTEGTLFRNKSGSRSATHLLTRLNDSVRWNIRPSCHHRARRRSRALL